MNIFHIAWRNLQHRWFASLLTLISMALGITLVVVVLTITGLISDSFERSKSVGYNFIVGPKGGEMQLTLNTVFLISEPVGTLPYSYFMEFMTEEKRVAEYERLGGKLDTPNRAGKYSLFVTEFAIPVCLGDFVDRFRVVGTTNEFFSDLRYGEANDRNYEFYEGRNFLPDSPEHGFFEAVIGSFVADELGLKIGDTVNPSHGSSGGESHSQAFTIVGILSPTSTAVDRGVFVNLEGFYRLDGHEAPERDAVTGLPLHSDDEAESDASAENSETDSSQLTGKQGMKPLEIDKREISAILVKTAPVFGSSLPRQINKSAAAMAVSPLSQITVALEVFFEPLRLGLLALTLLVCGVSAISILVSIYNSMNERSSDIAIMRALGASRIKVLMVILAESILIVVGGAFLGWLIGHIGAAWGGFYFEIEKHTGVPIALFSVNSEYEPWIIPGMILVGLAAGMLPAIMAYTTDVSKSLSK